MKDTNKCQDNMNYMRKKNNNFNNTLTIIIRI